MFLGGLFMISCGEIGLIFSRVAINCDTLLGHVFIFCTDSVQLF